MTVNAMDVSLARVWQMISAGMKMPVAQSNRTHGLKQKWQ